jgi:hypothetical protein
VKTIPHTEDKAVNVRFRLLLLGVALAFVLSALAPSPAHAFIKGCPGPEPNPPASQLPPDGGPPPDEPPDAGPAEPPEDPICEPEPEDPGCDPTTQSCPEGPAELRVVTFFDSVT